MCSRCCKAGFFVPLTLEDFEQWFSSGRYDLVISAVELYGFEALKVGASSVYVVPKNRLGSCVYLSPDGRCTIHHQKPLVCRLFPLSYDLEEDAPTIHPWARRNCLGLRLSSKFFDEEIEVARRVALALKHMDSALPKIRAMREEAYKRLCSTAAEALAIRQRLSYALCL